MSALASNVASIRPLVLAQLTAWKVSPQTGLSHPLDISGAETQADAVRLASMQCAHKDVFHVLVEDGATGRRQLHIYRVKQSSKPKRVDHEDGTWRVIKPLEADHVVSMQVDTFVPDEPFQWSPGCDVVGQRPAVVEG